MEMGKWIKYLSEKKGDATLIISSPITTSKTGNVTNKDNYWPIAITCGVSKIFDVLILHKYSLYLKTNDHQFGFKESHSSCLYIIDIKK